MERFKFRAWNRIVERMSKVFDLREDHCKTQWHILTIMQTIGIPDKYGNVIFEGDILKTSTGLCFVIWENGKFVVESPGSGAIDDMLLEDWRSSEIIGNIYENPKLLKPKLLKPKCFDKNYNPHYKKQLGIL